MNRARKDMQIYLTVLRVVLFRVKGQAFDWLNPFRMSDTTLECPNWCISGVFSNVSIKYRIRFHNQIEEVNHAQADERSSVRLMMCSMIKKGIIHQYCTASTSISMVEE